jgi:very-short-patch-repair endonuclease
VLAAREAEPPKAQGIMTDDEDQITTMVADYKAHLRSCLDRCGSPMEQRFLLALWRGDFFSDRLSEEESMVFAHRRTAGAYVVGACNAGPLRAVVQQHPVGPYRLDFAMLGVHDDTQPVAIEIDGHDYHERTKAQARHDRRRDRWLAQHGWLVLRYTGSEVFRDPDRLVRELVDTLEPWLSEAS